MNKLENYRIKAGISQTELAKKSGIDQPEISKAERGVKDLKGQAWASIAKVLNCTVDEILGVRNESKEHGGQEYERTVNVAGL